MTETQTDTATAGPIIHMALSFEGDDLAVVVKAPEGSPDELTSALYLLARGVQSLLTNLDPKQMEQYVYLGMAQTLADNVETGDINKVLEFLGA